MKHPRVIDGVPITQVEDPLTGDVLLTAHITRDWLLEAIGESRRMAEQRIASLTLHVAEPLLGMAAIEEQTIRARRMWISKFRLGRWGR